MSIRIFLVTIVRITCNKTRQTRSPMKRSPGPDWKCQLLGFVCYNWIVSKYDIVKCPGRKIAKSGHNLADWIAANLAKPRRMAQIPWRAQEIPSSSPWLVDAGIPARIRSGKYMKIRHKPLVGSINPRNSVSAERQFSTKQGMCQSPMMSGSR